MELNEEILGPDLNITIISDSYNICWRKGWDSNPRTGCPVAGFQDQCLKPLGHPSGPRLRSEPTVAIGLDRSPHAYKMLTVWTFRPPAGPGTGCRPGRRLPQCGIAGFIARAAARSCRPEPCCTRHARARRGHSRLDSRAAAKTWMAGASLHSGPPKAGPGCPAMTKSMGRRPSKLASIRSHEASTGGSATDTAFGRPGPLQRLLSALFTILNCDHSRQAGQGLCWQDRGRNALGNLAYRCTGQL